MANRPRHRRFGNIRKRESGRYQICYPGSDGRMHAGPETYARVSDAERALTLIEAQMLSGAWMDPEHGKVRLDDYADRWLYGKHISPHLGNMPLGKLSTAVIREWRANLLSAGVSVSVTAKACRLLRAVLMTAVEEDKILARNPCRIRGAGNERAEERPVLTVSQVFELADLVGRRPVGNVRKLPAGGYRLRFGRNGEMRTSPEIFVTLQDAERALWEMALGGRADCNHDRRYRALVLLATFASLRWGEVTALRRCDLDLEAGVVRLRAVFVERSAGEILVGPPKSRAGRRIVGIPGVILPALRHHMSVFAMPEPGSLAFPGQMGGPLRRGNLNKMACWPQAVAALGEPGFHFHDLRHTGNSVRLAAPVSGT